MTDATYTAGIHIDFVPVFKPGDPPPPGNGYNDWHEWAEVQYDAGLRQTQCERCQRYLFPQEMESHECQPQPTYQPFPPPPTTINSARTCAECGTSSAPPAFVRASGRRRWGDS